MTKAIMRNLVYPYVISQVFEVDDIIRVWKDINKDYFLQLSAKQGL